MNIGYARVSTEEQDLTARRNALEALGVAPERIYVDHGLTGTNRERPGCAKRSRRVGPAARWSSRSSTGLRDRCLTRDIADELTARHVKLNLGGSVHDPMDPVGRLLFNMLAMIAEFESDLIRMRTREGMAVARAAGKLRGRQPKLKPAQEAISRRFTGRGRRPRASSPSCSAFHARPCTARSSEHAGPAPDRQR
jgi:DNA invertase Pin-like site-specific DNA recombinase